jgi:hypothetical protein
MDKRKNNGGHSNGGRKPKAEEQKLVEKLSPLEPKAYQALEDAIEDNQSWAVKIFFEYMYGRPKQAVDVTSGGEKMQQPIITIDPLEND